MAVMATVIPLASVLTNRSRCFAMETPTLATPRGGAEDTGASQSRISGPIWDPSGRVTSINREYGSGPSTILDPAPTGAKGGMADSAKSGRDAVTVSLPAES